MYVQICACFSRNSNRFFSVIVATECAEAKPELRQIQETPLSDSRSHSNLELDNVAEAAATESTAAQDKQSEEIDARAASNEGTSPHTDIHAEDAASAEAADGKPSQNGGCLANADGSKDKSLPSKGNTGIDCNLEAPEETDA